MSTPPLSVTLPVLGIATRFDTNDRDVLDIVEEAFGVWRALDGTDVAPANGDDPLLVRILAEPGTEGDIAIGEHAVVRHHCPDATTVVFESPSSVAVSDPLRREAVVRVTGAMVADRLHFRVEMIEAVTLALLSHFDRHPVHAAAVARDGRAVLLAAPSGTGKSTLAYLCHIEGLDLLGDDHVRVQLEPRVRVWGWPSRVRLANGMNGAAKSMIDVRGGVTAARLVARDFTVCILSRTGGPAALHALDPSALERALGEQMAPGFDRFPARWPAVANALTARGGWGLELSGDPREALPFVREMLRAVDGHDRTFVRPT